MKCGKTGIYDDNGNELCTGDTVQQKYGHNIIIDPFGSQIPGAFTYHPEGTTNKTAHYLAVKVL